MTIEFGSVLSGAGAILGGIAAVVSLGNRSKIKEVHVLFNSRFDQLLKLTSEASHAQGVADERANPGGGK